MCSSTLIDGQIAFVQLQDDAVDRRCIDGSDLSVGPAATGVGFLQDFFLQFFRILIPAISALAVDHLSVVKMHVVPVSRAGF